MKQQLLFFLVILCAYALATANAVIYPGVVANNLFGFDTRWLLIFLPLVVIIYRRITILPPTIWQKLHNTYLVPMSLIVSGVLVYTQYQTPANYVYGTLHVDYAAAWYLSLTMLFVALATQTAAWFQHNWKRIILFIPPIFLTTALAILVETPLLYADIIIEDSLIEWLQLLAYFVSAVMSGLIASKLWKNNKLLAVLFTFASIVFFVMCGEEISWGQRIFNTQTPEELAAINLQSETNLHNIDWIFPYVYRGYILLGMYGTLSAVVLFIVQKTKLTLPQYTRLFLPGWQFVSWFGVAGYYFLQRFYFIEPDLQGANTWEENMELLLIGAVAVFLTQQYLLFIDSRKKT